jgi:hypothetical protein
VFKFFYVAVYTFAPEVGQRLEKTCTQPAVGVCLDTHPRRANNVTQVCFQVAPSGRVARGRLSRIKTAREVGSQQMKTEGKRALLYPGHWGLTVRTSHKIRTEELVGREKNHYVSSLTINS